MVVVRGQVSQQAEYLDLGINAMKPSALAFNTLSIHLIISAVFGWSQVTDISQIVSQTRHIFQGLSHGVTV